MQKAFFIIFIFLLLANVSNSAQQNFGVPSGIPVKGYRLVWSDEFNGRSLDKSKWGFRCLGRRKGGINVKDTVSLDGEGHLVLTVKRDGYKYNGSMIGTQGKFETTFGYFECRVQFQKQEGFWSAFWLQSPTIGEKIGNTSESGTEIDIFEYLRTKGENIQHTLHWDGYRKNHKTEKKTSFIRGLTKGWHTVGLLWTSEDYIFYVDGNETWRTKRAISRRPEYLILSMEIGKWGGDISKAKLPDSLSIDYIRIYQKENTSRL